MRDSDDKLLPIDAAMGKPLQPRAHVGYYPRFSTLDQQEFWDEATRKVVLARVEHVPPLRFFSPAEARFMQVVFDHLLPQQDRDEAHRVPILNFVDARLYENRIDGYRFETMPPDRDAYRLGIRAIENVAHNKFAGGFLDLDPLAQDWVLKSIHDGDVETSSETWQRLPTHLFWMLLVQDAIEAYYSHPWAWDEIGFGGPAYPRAYMRLEHGMPEPWEVNEKRYEWKAPATSVSDRFEPIGGQSEHSGTPGQGGSH